MAWRCCGQLSRPGWGSCSRQDKALQGQQHLTESLQDPLDHLAQNWVSVSINDNIPPPHKRENNLKGTEGGFPPISEQVHSPVAAIFFRHWAHTRCRQPRSLGFLLWES